MTAHEGPRQELWIEVPATSSAEDLARVVDEFPPGTAGRFRAVRTAATTWIIYKIAG